MDRRFFRRLAVCVPAGIAVWATGAWLIAGAQPAVMEMSLIWGAALSVLLSLTPFPVSD